MYAEISSGAAQERGEEQGANTQEIMSKKHHEKMTMTKKEKVIRILGGKIDRMIEVKSMTSKNGHQNFRRKNCKSSRVTELCHFFNPSLTTGYRVCVSHYWSAEGLSVKSWHILLSR